MTLLNIWYRIKGSTYFYFYILLFSCPVCSTYWKDRESYEFLTTVYYELNLNARTYLASCIYPWLGPIFWSYWANITDVTSSIFFYFLPQFMYVTYVLSVRYTETKYIKVKTKNQKPNSNFFLVFHVTSCVNFNWPCPKFVISGYFDKLVTL